MAKKYMLKRIAAGSTEFKVWALDNNGRVWSLAASAGQDGVEWVNDEIARAAHLSVDGQGNVWTVNAAGQIHMRTAGKGVAAKGEWSEHSLRDAAGQLVKATQIAAGDTTVVVIDDQKRIWQRTGSEGWALNPHAGNIRLIAAGGAGNPVYCINDLGTLYAQTNDGWGERANLTNVAALDVGFDNSVCYLGTNGHVHQPRPGQAGVYVEDMVGKGIAFAVRNIHDIWMINEAGEIWRRTHQPYTSTFVVGGPLPVTVEGAGSYVWSRTKEPQFAAARVYWPDPGETFNQIAADLGTTPAALQAKNKQIANTDQLKAGEPIHLV